MTPELEQKIKQHIKEDWRALWPNLNYEPAKIVFGDGFGWELFAQRIITLIKEELKEDK